MTLYQTADNLRDEQLIADRFCSQYNVRAIKLPIKYKIDFLLLGKKTNTCLGVLEVKARNINFSEHENIILSAGKWEALIWWGNTFMTEARKSLACMFCCKFDDGFYGYKWHKDHEIKVTMGGRNVARCESDFEPVVLIPTKYFKEF